jgi:hypothetical protein
MCVKFNEFYFEKEMHRKPVLWILIHIWPYPELFKLGGSGFGMNLCIFSKKMRTK